MPDAAAERRTFALDRSAIRSVDGKVKFTGHAAVFGQRTWIGPKRYGFWEEVAPGAFARALKEDDVRFLLEHDPRWILGRNTAGTLSLSEDKVGLAVSSEFPDTSYARDAAESIQRGDLSQMSFGFIPKEERIEELEDGDMLRVLTDVELWDVSVVAFPAYEGTDAALRSLEARRMEGRKLRFEELRRRLDAAAEGR